MKTLKDVMPYEFSQQYLFTPSHKYLDVEVTAVHGEPNSADQARWPGPQKNVYFWVELANGYAVGWNENPARGWSFPAVRMRKDTK